MTLTAISAAVDPSTCQPLAEYQSSTPATFFSGPPVLHYHNPSTILSISAADLATQPHISALFNPSSPSPDQADGISPSTQRTTTVVLLVTSRDLSLWSPSTSAGISIGYRDISLHARQGSALYMQLILADAEDERPVSSVPDEELVTVEMLLTPSLSSTGTEGLTNGHAHSEVVDEVQRLYDAVSACADLHPDPDPDDEAQEAGAGLAGMLAGLSGEGIDLEGGGWITADNVDEHMTAQERWEGQEEGDAEEQKDGSEMVRTGTRRGLDEADGGEETKWRRTE